MLPLLIVYLDHIGYNPSDVGFILGIGWVLGTFGGPIAGYLSDRVGDKKVFLTIISLWAISEVYLLLE
jgi:MFS family permease